MKASLAVKSQPHIRMPRLRHWLRPCLLGILLASGAIAYGEAAVEAWVRRYGGVEGSEDMAYKVATDSAGNVIVAGTHERVPSTPELLIIKYSGAGVPLWTNRYDGSAAAQAIAVDA